MKKTKSKKRSWLSRITPQVGLGDRMFSQLPFIFFCFVLAMITVWNVHRAQKTLRSIEAARTELQQLRWHASAVQSQIMYNNKQSEVLRQMKSHNLGLAGTSPRRIIGSDSQ